VTVAAKAAGQRWGVAISVPDGCCEPARQSAAAGALSEKELGQMSGAEIVALAKHGVPLSAVCTPVPRVFFAPA
jgi:hypothetical protein